MTDEEKYKQEMRDAGVELEALEETEEAEETEEETEKPLTPKKKLPDSKKEEEEGSDEKTKTSEEEEEEELTPPPKEKKRSIYEEYKDKKSELKIEREQRQIAETERDNLKQKLDALGNSKTTEEKKEALDDLDAFAQEIGADPEKIKKMQALFLKNLPKNEIDPLLVKRLENFEKFEKTNQVAMDKQAFEEEFSSSLTKIKSFFPKATDAEMATIKTKIDKISHSKDWHDKSLSYIAFEHKEILEALISPKKRGMETKGKKDDTNETDSTTDFDISADYSKMSFKEREAWEEKYKALGKTDGLVTTGKGKKIMI